LLANFILLKKKGLAYIYHYQINSSFCGRISETADQFSTFKVNIMLLELFSAVLLIS